jgi:hypothetical protein
VSTDATEAAPAALGSFEHALARVLSKSVWLSVVTAMRCIPLMFSERDNVNAIEVALMKLVDAGLAQTRGQGSEQVWRLVR